MAESAAHNLRLHFSDPGRPMLLSLLADPSAVEADLVVATLGDAADDPHARRQSTISSTVRGLPLSLTCAARCSSGWGFG